MSTFFDRDGRPMSPERWGELHGVEDYIRIASTELADCWVSTVWIGLDYGWGRTPRPITFETLIFGGPLDGSGERYASPEAAAHGHRVWVRVARNVGRRRRRRRYKQPEQRRATRRSSR